MATGGVREVGVRIKVGATGLEEATRLSRSLKDLGVDAEALDKRAGELSAELTRLGQQQALIDGFKRKKAATEEAAKALQQAQEAAQKLGREFGATEEPTKRQEQALARARAEVTKAKTAYQESGLALQTARKGLSDAGIGSDELAAAQVRVRKQTTETQQAVAELTNRYRAAEGQAKLSAQQQAQLARATTEAGSASTRAANEQAAAGQKVAGSLEGVQQRLSAIGKLAVGGVLGAGSLNFLRGVTATADAFNNLRARMQLVTGEGPALDAALLSVQEIALRTGASLENTGTLFTRVLSAGREMGLAQADALRLTESINQAVAISGASAAASDAAITQLIQGLQSGVLRGEEFNSVVEQSPRLAQALADGMGVARSELRGLAQDGKISAETVIQALQSQADVLEREFGQLPQTVGRAVENLNTAWSVFVGNLDRTTGFTSAVASGIGFIADNLDELAAVAGRAGAVIVAALAVKAAGALRDLATQALASASSFGVLLTSIEKIPRTVNIAIAVTGFEVGFQIGQMLRENSALARQLGVAVTEFFTNIVRDLQFVVEAGRAIFTDDTIGAAFERLKQRAAEQQAIFADLYADARRAPQAVAQAAAGAEQSLGALGAQAQGVGLQLGRAGAAGAAGVQQLGQAADTAAGALAALVAGATAALPKVGETAAAQARELARLAEGSEEVRRRLADGIPAALEKLNGTQLVEFRAELERALQGSAKGAEVLQAALQEVGRRAAQALGVDLAGASATVTRQFAQQMDALSALIRALPVLERTGVDTARVVADALAKMVDGARSQAELDALRTRIEALGKAGELSREQVVRLMDTITAKAAEAASSVSLIDEALKTFGITTQAELKKTADNFKQAWDRIRENSTVTLDQKRQAFVQYANAAIAANGGVIDSQIRSQAQAFKLAVEVDKTGKAVVRAMGEGALASDQLSGGFRTAAEQARKLGAEVATLTSQVGNLTAGWEKALRARNAAVQSTLTWEGRDAAGNLDRTFVGSSGGSTFTPPPDNSGDWVWMATAARPGGEWVLTPEASARRFADQEQARGLVPVRDPSGSVRYVQPSGAPSTGAPSAAAPASAPVPAPAPAPQPSAAPAPTSVVEIRFTRGDGSYVPAVVSSQQAADELAALLREEMERRGG
mgnify:CR=1 FL=1